MAKKNKEESKPKGALSRNQQIEEYLNMKYEFRFNVVKTCPEYREIESEKEDWMMLEDYDLNTMWRELYTIGIDTSPSNINNILQSSFNDKVDPIKQYFNTLPKYDGKDYINALSQTVKVHNPERWYEYFKMWLVGVVANACIDYQCMNHVCLVLTGSQGKFKTTWLENLCPKSLRERYLATLGKGQFDPNHKDSLSFLHEYLLVNLDDILRQLNKQDENQLKSLITMPHLTYRRSYGRLNGFFPHRASFMASVNGNDFLTDPTGSRRFIPFEVSDIDINKAQAVDMDKVWSQAVALFKEGFLYWFKDHQLDELNENNRLFQVVSAEEELLIEYFDVPKHPHEATHVMQHAMIQSYLESITKGKLNKKKLSEALVKLKFHKSQKMIENSKERKWVWHVSKKELNEVDLQNKNTTNDVLPPVPVAEQTHQVKATF